MRRRRARSVAVFEERASGLSEDRPRLDGLLAGAAAGDFAVVRVTREDRLSRSGGGSLTRLLADRGVRVEVLHVASAGGMP